MAGTNRNINLNKDMVNIYIRNDFRNTEWRRKMKKYDVKISGFSDEISSDFTEQLRVVRDLGMNYISLRSADGKGIAEYSAEEVERELIPRLKKTQVNVSSIGSPIGKVSIEDRETGVYVRRLW